MHSINLEKILIFLIIGVFVVTSASSLTGVGARITREEAVEISRNAELVEKGIAASNWSRAGANFFNSSLVEQMKNTVNRDIKEIYEKVPEGHGVWRVVWIFPTNKISQHYEVFVIIDAENGAIVDERGQSVLE